MSEWPKTFDRTPLEPEKPCMEPAWVQGGCRTAPVGLKWASRWCKGAVRDKYCSLWIYIKIYFFCHL